MCKRFRSLNHYYRCVSCEKEHKEWRDKFTHLTSSPGEWTRGAKQELITHSKDTLQPMKKDGTINKHFVQAHGTKSLEKELKVSKREILDNVAKYG